jgi:ABC-2 type transport system permease protein
MLIIGFLFYFIGGYIFYGAQFAAVGAAVTDEGESQQFMLPILLPIIMAFVFTSIAIEQPGSAAAWWGSMLPFTSPIVMMARLPFGVSIPELLLSLSILLASGILMVALSSRIYRIGILVQGKKVTFSEIGKWLLKG